jgi:hypothetical protein
LAASALVLDRNHWPEHTDYQLTFGENEVRKFHSNERDTICGFHEYLTEEMVLEKSKHLEGAFSMIPIS